MLMLVQLQKFSAFPSGGKEFLGTYGPTGCIYWHFLTREPWRWEDGQSSTFRQQSWEQGEHFVTGFYLSLRVVKGASQMFTQERVRVLLWIQETGLGCWAPVAKQVGEGRKSQNRVPERVLHPLRGLYTMETSLRSPYKNALQESQHLAAAAGGHHWWGEKDMLPYVIK